MEIGRRAFRVGMCAINFIDSDRQWSKARRGLGIWLRVEGLGFRV